MKKFLFILTALLIFNSTYANKNEDEISTYIIRQSRISYNQYVAQHGTVSDPQWEEAVVTVFTRLIVSSGERGFDVQVALIKDPTFNACCFPGGEFIINSGTLDAFNAIIRKETESKPGIDAQALRENLIAPVIAHELGHYYNRHLFKAIKKNMDFLASSSKDMEFQTLQYSISNEYEADYTGYILMQKADYDTDYMLSLLESLNSLYQKSLEHAEVIDTNQYFQTHPSPHKRLARFNSNRQKYHEIAAELEKAFDDVQVGINLQRAIDFLEKAEKEFPGNLFIRKERAVALHKLWLTTVPIDQQKLKGIIDTPPFRDDMVFDTERGQSRGREVPGNKEYYNKAYEAYMNVYRDADDPAFDLNFALLLVYSPDQEKKNVAFQLSYNAAVKTNRLDMASNHAMVLFLLDEKDNALQIMAEVAKQYDSNYQAIIDKATEDPEYLAYIQQLHQNLSVAGQLNSSYVIDGFTPLLNLALMARYTGNKEIAMAAAEKYLTTYEHDSKWAKYLSGLTGVAVKEQVRSYPAVDGVRVLNTIQQVLNKWGKADNIFPVETGEEIWCYSDRDIKLSIVNNQVTRIVLDSGKSRKIENGIGVGASMQNIEKSLGKHSSVIDGYYIYKDQTVAVMYVNNVAKQIILLP
ncbi:MAG TPA: M48 family metallopeptidase [Spirochaetota bacterium]|nr:M48 family metallopeptidase [Spirochaetota bacterium]